MTNRKAILTYCEQQGFDHQQICQISIAISIGQSWSQIKLYAKKEFDANQMAQIRYAFSDKLPLKIIELIANPSISCDKMADLVIMARKYKNINNFKKKVALSILES